MVDIFLFIAGTIGLLRNLLNILNSELTNYNQILAYIGMIFIGNYGFFNFIKVIKLILDSKE
jgi:arginine exporter protein ArgO